MNDATGRVMRSILQFLAGGGITLVVSALAEGLSPVASAMLLAFNTLAVTMAQNFLEAKGVIGAILKGPTAGPAVGEVVDSAGEVVGQVVGSTTGLVEGVAGTIIDEVGDIVGAVAPKDEDE